MAITDKTRKVLWARSGGLCAICKCELVLDSTNSDDESVVGEECHIVSGQANGPRYDSAIQKGQIDLYNNLILLCRVHHKMIDDQHKTYPADILRQMKANHEMWFSEKLRNTVELKPLRLRRIKQNIPAHLTRLTTGKHVLSIVDGACISSFDHDELKSEQELELVSGFLQTVQDWGDIGADLEPSDWVRIGFELTESLRELEDAGFFVFGAREIQLIEGGIGGSSDWPVAILRVLRKTNESIITVSLDDLKTENVEKSVQPDT